MKGGAVLRMKALGGERYRGGGRASEYEPSGVGGLKVSEIFHSIQGEGLNAGTPSVFLRLALCNLRCVWCDTAYTWDWENYDPSREVREMGLGEVEGEILRYGCRRLVVTGGEPLLQQSALHPLLASLKGRGFVVEVETNGTVAPSEGLVGVVDQWNVSPKLGSSGNPHPLREVERCYKVFTSLPNSHFKYVVEDEGDLSEVGGLVRRYRIPRERVILMPQARNREEMGRRGVWLVEVCKEHGYRYSPRLQTELFGGRRGV